MLTQLNCKLYLLSRMQNIWTRTFHEAQGGMPHHPMRRMFSETFYHRHNLIMPCQRPDIRLHTLSPPKIQQNCRRRRCTMAWLFVFEFLDYVTVQSCSQCMLTCSAAWRIRARTKHAQIIIFIKKELVDKPLIFTLIVISKSILSRPKSGIFW